MFANVMSQHALPVLTGVVTIRTEEGLLGVLGNDDLEPAGVVPLGHVVLLLPVLVLRVRHKPADLALVSRHTHARLFELLVCLRRNTS